MKILDEIKFNKDGLVPVIVQDKYTKDILMLAYANKEAIEKTLKTKHMHYFSRSRKKLWKKGETSGNIQKLKSIYIDCDSDTLLVEVEQKGVACHTGNRTCFYRKLQKGEWKEIK